MSAARLAAEAAFGDRPFRPALPSAAQVIVRRARLAAEIGSAAAADDTNPMFKPADKSPRVFRVEAALTPKPADAPTHDPVPPASTGPSGRVGATLPRSRRIAPDKRPGPVLHVVHALPARQPRVESSTPDLAALAAALARVDPVLASIERLQSFQVVDDRFADDWLRLSLQVDAIRAELKTRLRWIDQQAARPTR